jgi:pimeloyl-ACP methyl ester carboxylesterase
MKDRLDFYGGAGKPVVFAHANGYPPGSYRQFIAPLLDHCQLTAYRHRPLWGEKVPPRRLNWTIFADDLIHTLEAGMDGPVWMMGHSLGGAVSMMAATRRPDLFRGLILIDPVLMPTRRVLAMRLTPRRTRERMPMIRKTLNRPNQFADHQAAFDFHRGKRAFTDMSDEVLWDYVHAGTVAEGGQGLQLAFGREWEAGVYTSVPWLWPLLRRLRLPTLGLRGETSDVLGPGAMRRWALLQPAAELHSCPGGHLLPMEQPAGTAGYVIDFLQRQDD